MKYFRTKYITPCILCMLVLSYSCKKFLNQPPVSSLTTQVLATKAGIDGLLIGAYSLVDGVYNGQQGSPWTTGTDNWIYGSVAADDAHKGSSPGDQSDAGAIEAYQVNATNGYIDPKWRMCYAGVQRANDVLRELPLVKDGSVSAAYAAEVRAEAHFLLGFYHLEAAKLWKNVPYVDSTITYTAGNFKVGNPGTIWDKIEADFKLAASILPATQSNVGRANLWAAKAFLAKTYMFAHDYNSALPILTDVINNGTNSQGIKYGLMPYANNFNSAYKNGIEGVFIIQASVGDGANGLNGNAGSVLNFPSGGPAGCCGFFQPSFSLANAFKVDATTGLPLITTYNNTDLKNDQGISASDSSYFPGNEPVDSRIDWSIGRRGIPYLDWGICPGKSWARDQADGGPYLPIKNVYYKSAQSSTSDAYGGWAANQSTSNGYNAIRFADVLLWAAECEVEVGSLANAEADVNRVRARAADASGWVKGKLTGYGTNSAGKLDATLPIVDNTQYAANYKVGLYTGQFSANGQAFAREAVYFERRIELAMEGHRFFDLSRWDGVNGGPEPAGYMGDQLTSYLAHENAVPNYPAALLKVARFTKGTNELYPIPQTEIDETQGTLKQNKGY